MENAYVAVGKGAETGSTVVALLDAKSRAVAWTTLIDRVGDTPDGSARAREAIALLSMDGRLLAITDDGLGVEIELLLDPIRAEVVSLFQMRLSHPEAGIVTAYVTSRSRNTLEWVQDDGSVGSAMLAKGAQLELYDLAVSSATRVHQDRVSFGSRGWKVNGELVGPLPDGLRLVAGTHF